MWDKFELNKILKKSYNEAIKLMLGDRLLEPSSKLSTYNKKEYYQGFAGVKLEQLYRGLDLLSSKEEKLKHHILTKQQKLCKLDVVFFDVTTLYFESQQADDLREFGYSKDCKFNEVQVVLSLLINAQGRPLSYEIFAGNTFEGNTLLPVLDNLQKNYNIGKVVVVADRGIGSKNNLELIKTHGYDYIVGAKLRDMSKKIQEKALSLDDYKTLNNDSEKRYKIIDDKDEQLLLLYSSKRASKDAKDRQRLVDKACKLLEKDGVASSRGVKKYIISTKQSHKLNQTKIEKDALFDGLYALHFSDSNMSAIELSQAYHQLWKIEESFRTMKSLFEARPMFHWTSKRIRGHIMLNFILRVLENDLLMSLKDNGMNCSHMQLREMTKGLQKSIIEVGNKKLNSYAPLSDNQKEMLKTLKITIPRNSIV